MGGLSLDGVDDFYSESTLNLVTASHDFCQEKTSESGVEVYAVYGTGIRHVEPTLHR